jgi:glycerate dehydrogenase
MTPPQAKIVFLDAATYGDVSLARFTALWDCTIHQTTKANQTEQRLTGHGIAVTNKVEIDELILSSPEARDLKLIAVAATGTDIIDRMAASAHGVKVCNVPGYATESVAQFTMALILELSTRVGKYSDAVKRAEWEQSPVFTLLGYRAIELKGKTLGIIGYGNIGRRVAEIARGFGMEILVAVRPENNASVISHRLPINDLLRQADVVSLHCPLMAETRNLINRSSLALMKPTAFLINTARGALIDETALVDALHNNSIGAAALDVITAEPPSPDHPIIRAAKTLDNLIVTPHTAWSAREARERLLDEVKVNIAAFLRGERRNLVA